jgi:hypothetical protein
LLIIDPLEAKPTSCAVSIQAEHPLQSLQALQEARQFSAEGTSMSIERAVALRDYPLDSKNLVIDCDNLANPGRFG